MLVHLLNYIIRASADYFVDHNGNIYQYNMEIDNRYTWAVGGDKYNTLGGDYYKIVENQCKNII